MPTLGSALQTLQELNLIGRLRDHDTLGESTNIRQLLSTALEELKLYDTEVSIMYNRIETLFKDKASLRRQIDIGSSFLAPIRLLPAEVLTQIFEFACSDGFEHTVNGDPVVLVVSSVCTAWRAIAVGTPALWAGLVATATIIHEERYTTVPRNIRKPFLQHMLERTKGIPLFLPLLENGKSIEFFKPFFPQCHECGSLVPRTTERLKELLASMPRLRQCELDLKYIDALPISDADVDLSTITPNLRHVAVSKWIGLRWDQITVLVAPAMLTSTLRRILSQTLLLETLSLPTPFTNNDPDADILDRRPVILPNLNWLTLTLSASELHASQLDAALAFLQLPRLKSLSLRRGLESDAVSVVIPASITSLLQRSHAEIQELHIEWFFAHSPSLLALLRNIPSLTRLWYYCFGAQDDESPEAANEGPERGRDLIRALNVQPGSIWEPTADPLLPQLATLCLGLPGGSFTDEEFVSMTLSRWRSPSANRGIPFNVTNLKRVELEIAHRAFDISRWDSLRNPRAEGLSIDIEDSYGDVRTRLVDGIW